MEERVSREFAIYKKCSDFKFDLIVFLYELLKGTFSSKRNIIKAELQKGERKPEKVVKHRVECYRFDPLHFNLSS